MTKERPHFRVRIRETEGQPLNVVKDDVIEYGPVDDRGTFVDVSSAVTAVRLGGEVGKARVLELSVIAFKAEVEQRPRRQLAVVDATTMAAQGYRAYTRA